MLLILAAPDVRDHLSDREVSTILFLPTSIGSMVGELPRALDISGQWISITIQQNMKSSHNFEFREAVQFCYLSKIERYPIFLRYSLHICKSLM